MKKYRKLLIGMLTSILVVSNIFITNAFSSELYDYELTIEESEIQKAMEEVIKKEDLISYTFTLKEPEQITIYNDNNEKLPEEVSESIDYMLEPDLYAIIDSILLPYDSNSIKKELLDFLVGKKLVHHYKEGELGEKNENCQILVITDPKTKQLYVLSVNNGESNYSCSLQVNFNDGREKIIETSNVNIKTVRNEQEISPEQLESLQQKENIETEIISIVTTITNNELEEDISEEETNDEITKEEDTTNQILEKVQEEDDIPNIEPETMYDVNVIENNKVLESQEYIDLTGNSFAVMEATYDVPSNTTPEITNRGIDPLQYDKEATLSGDKRAKKVAGTDDLFEITLEVTGENGTGSIMESAPADVVLVLDVSSSMDTSRGTKNTRWQETKPALNKITETLLGDDDADIKMALVGFAGNRWDTSFSISHTVYTGFTSNATEFSNIYKNCNTAEALRNSVPGVTIGPATNAQAGLLGAYDILESRKDNNRNKYVIMVSDGEPNRLYGSRKKPYNEVGDSTSNGENAINAAINESAYLKREGYTVISVGVDMTQDDAWVNKFLNGVATSTDHVAWTSAENLSATLEKIANDIREVPLIKEHGTVELTDTISEYVEYVNNYNGETIKGQVSYNNGGSWYSHNQAGIAYTKDANGKEVIKWSIPSFNENNKYRIVYYVRIKDAYLGEKIHKDQTSGTNPETGTDGVIANGETYLVSDEITNNVDIKVPTVYAPKPIVQPASFTSEKLAQVIDSGLGKYRISVTYQGQHERKTIEGVTTIKEQTNITLIDPMSEYVNYSGNPTIEYTNRDVENWQPYTNGVLSENNGTLNLRISQDSEFENRRYRLSYDVQVKDVYAGNKKHADQISGDNPPIAAPGDAVGVLANGKTYLYSNLIEMHEIMVPSIYRDPPIIEDGDIYGTKVAVRINPTVVENNGGTGVVANGYTYVKSSILTDEKEILVPTVRLDPPITVSVKKKIEDRKKLPIEEFYFMLTGPNGYEQYVTIGSLEMNSTDESDYFTFQEPPGGFVYGTYTLKEIFVPNSRYSTSKISVYEDNIKKGERSDSASIDLSFEPGDENVDIEVINKPKISTKTVPDIKSTKEVLNSSGVTETFVIKLIPLTESLREGYTVTVPIEVNGTTATIEGIEGILFNTPYYIEEQNVDDYYVTYYVKMGATGTKNEDKYFEITDANTEVEITIENEKKPPTTPFNFIKIIAGTNNVPLSDAEFRLFKCTIVHEHEPSVNQPIVDARNCWVPMGEEHISDGSGVVDFGTLLDGDYMLVETKAPIGYETPLGQWRLKIDSTQSEEDRIKITTANGLPKPPAFKRDNATGILYLPNNQKFDLPTSGSGGIYPYIIFGIATLVISGLLLFDYQRKKKIQKPVK
ncbi:MAG: SpaA isopeptide-forming pilin-related protein [Coprobacillaceae bacterium]